MNQIEETHKARHGEGAWSPYALPASPCVHQPRSSPNTILLGFSRGFITQAGLINLLAIIDCFNLPPLSPPSKSEDGTKNSNPLIMRLATSHHPEVIRSFSKVTSLIQEHLIRLITQESPSVLGALCQRLDNTYLL